MFEKVNPAHPDKVADRIAGALVDIAYNHQESPKVAIEVLIGHGRCNLICESSYQFSNDEIASTVERIVGYPMSTFNTMRSQDEQLAANQKGIIRCGDNGIFKGAPITDQQKDLVSIARTLYECYKSDGKYLSDGKRRIICQSMMKRTDALYKASKVIAEVNPLGYWTGGLDVDSGATNRKLGSDLGDGITGGGIHGKDLSKADVTLNIYAHLKAQEIGKPVELSCAIGDEYIDGKPYGDIVEEVKYYIASLGGFEALAEWGLIR